MFQQASNLRLSCSSCFSSKSKRALKVSNSSVAATDSVIFHRMLLPHKCALYSRLSAFFECRLGMWHRVTPIPAASNPLPFNYATIIVPNTPCRVLPVGRNHSAHYIRSNGQKLRGRRTVLRTDVALHGLIVELVQVEERFRSGIRKCSACSHGSSERFRLFPHITQNRKLSPLQRRPTLQHICTKRSYYCMGDEGGPHGSVVEGLTCQGPTSVMPGLQ